tara:strand:+ start:369 stop:668 length:300 start_codon:yes stop_codon:yes gene_type:complete
MASNKGLGRAKRFGARYGRKPKLKFASIEAQQKKQYKCPYCHAIKVKRESVGIWNCIKCKSKFAGRAYSLVKTVKTVEEKPVEKLTEEQPKEEQKAEAI